VRTNQEFGAVPGWHRVTIAPSSQAAPGSTLVTDLPRKYSDPEQSGLLREIKAGRVVEQDFQLE
jgi:hypothetical protein